MSGCNSPNYINVPAVDGNIAFNDSDAATVRKMEKVALAAILEQANIPGDIAVRFPMGTSELTAIRVTGDETMPDNVYPEGQTPTGEFILIEIREVHARGATGWVDIIRPGTTRPRELVSVHLRWNFNDGWAVERMRVWSFDVDAAEPDLIVAPAEERPEAPAVEEALESIEETPESSEEMAE